MPEREDAPLHEQEQEELLSPDMLLTDDDEQETPDEEPAAEVDEQPEDEPTPPEDDPGEVETEPEEPHDELNERLRRAVETFENAANRLRNNPTEQNQKAAEKAKSRLDTLLESDDLDLEPSKAIKEVASEVQTYQRQSGETQSQYDARLARLEQQNALLQEQVYRREIEAEYPQIKGRYDAIKQAAQRRTQAIIGNDPVHPSVYERVWQNAWQTEFQSALGQTTPSEKPKAPDPTPKPKATQPIKSKSGQSRKQEDPDAKMRSVLDSFISDD